MPILRDIEVHVTNDKNQPLQEWGIGKRDRSQQTWCYIQSETNMPFRIQIKPKLPFPMFEPSQAARRQYHTGKTSSTWEAEQPRHEDFDGLSSLFWNGEKAKEPPKTPSYLPSPQGPAPWHLLVTMRLDGRRPIEKSAILYLDIKHPNCLHYQPNGLVMATRTQKDEDGNLVDCGWLFKDVGIENVFDQLLLSTTDTDQPQPAKDEEDFLAAFDGLAADGMEDAQEKATVGQIEITLERVPLGLETTSEWKRQQYYDYGADSLDPRELARARHTTARDAGRRKSSRAMNWIHYDPVPGDEIPFATFKFYYRHEDKLRKFGFPGFPPVSTDIGAIIKTKRERMRALNEAAAAPLSILKPKLPNPVYICDDEDVAVGLLDPPPPSAKNKAKQAVGENEDEDTDQPWVPNNSKLPNTAPVAKMYESIETPPASPAHREDTDSPPHSSPPPSTPVASIRRRNTSSQPDSPSPAARDNDLEQSSADGSSSLKAPLLATFNAHVDLMKAFRKMEDSITEGEEADDEASDGGETETEGEEEETGVSEDRPDEGLGEGLGKIELGSKRAGEDVEEEGAKKMKAGD